MEFEPDNEAASAALPGDAGVTEGPDDDGDSVVTNSEADGATDEVKAATSGDTEDGAGAEVTATDDAVTGPVADEPVVAPAEASTGDTEDGAGDADASDAGEAPQVVAAHDGDEPELEG